MAKSTATRATPRKAAAPAPKAEPAPIELSPSGARRERERQETRALIMAAARELFTRDGYDKTTMRAIADRIGYTATAIYHHFADKDTLMMELCLVDFRALHVALTSISQVSDPVERIRLMGTGYVRFALQNPEQFRFMFLIERPLPSPEQIAKIGDPGDDAYLQLRRAVAEAIEARRFRPDLTDPDLVAQVLWGCVHGIATIHVVTPPEKQKWMQLRNADETAKVACTALLNGLLTPAPV
jgi:AcrR family transcriptional regulator